MKIILTGSSSFTGMHFALALANCGHHVICPLLRQRKAYVGLRKERILLIEQSCEVQEETSFGSDRFLRLSGDVLCHHAADVTDYKNPKFNIEQAVENNTFRLEKVLERVTPKLVILTCSIFEPGEGSGTERLRAVSPYGLSKGITTKFFQTVCREKKIPLKKFVIPNPFGPYEEIRLTTSLIQTWNRGETAEIHSPNYVRDNIPASLLAKVYASYVEDKIKKPKLSPSFYAEKQGEFVARFAREMECRLPIKCLVKEKVQTVFEEPEIRVNTDPIAPSSYQWEETEAWDQLARFYQSHYLNYGICK